MVSDSIALGQGDVGGVVASRQTPEQAAQGKAWSGHVPSQQSITGSRPDKHQAQQHLLRDKGKGELNVPGMYSMTCPMFWACLEEGAIIPGSPSFSFAQVTEPISKQYAKQQENRRYRLVCFGRVPLSLLEAVTLSRWLASKSFVA